MCDEQVDVFIDEYSYQISEEIEQEQKNAPSLTRIFEIMPSRADGNCLFRRLNNLIFRGTRNINDLKVDISNYII